MKPNTVGRTSGTPVAPSPALQMGLMAQSMILTLQGEIPVADLMPGMRVVTRDSGTAMIRNLRRRRVVTDAVRILAGSLGHTRPDSDVILPAGQQVLLRDWRAEALFGASQVMVPAHKLIDGEFVSALGAMTLDLCEIEFDRPHILYVDGLEVAGHLATATDAIAA